MRRRPVFWFLLSLFFFCAAYVSWHLGEQKAAKPALPVPKPVGAAQRTRNSTQASPLLTTPALLAEARDQAEAKRRALLSLCLTNTSLAPDLLLRRDTAILLENARLDTAAPLNLRIPEQLRSSKDPGAYVVQSRGPITEAFRAQLRAAGASIVSYIPNNAYLVRASQSAVEVLRASPQTQAVLPFEPYYKLKLDLLQLAVKYAPMPDGSQINLLLFADNEEATVEAVKRLGAEVLSRQLSPFGPVLRVQPLVDSLPMLASLPGVQELEFAHARVPANDLSRARLGISTNTTTSSDYLGLSGSNVLVAVADTGIDATHPDLSGRVSYDLPVRGTDTNGHGTTIAGIIAGSGSKSISISNAVPGSSNPPVALQFRGKAPSARLLALPMVNSDQYVQETAARSNATVFNGSFTYGISDYDLAAASYDAAVRDSLPGMTGSQQMTYVFPAGNGGGLNNWDGGGWDNGNGGLPDTIQSPGTAKNVITVGAIEQYRRVTNQVTPSCSSSGSCAPINEWLPSTDSSNQVAGFSGRGNVGVGIEGSYGRTKPDVVAPGTFVLSTRPSNWDQATYYNPTNTQGYYIPGALIQTNAFYSDDFFVPLTAIKVAIELVRNSDSPDPLPNMPIKVSTNGFDYSLAGSNNVATFPASGALGPVDQYWQYRIEDGTNSSVSLDVRITITVTNQYGNFLQVLKGINDSVGTWYRYESGTSMAAADASGVLALMQEFFSQRLKLTNASPALLKALLINGARTLSQQYDFQVNSLINHQGWGLINLPNSAPASLSNSISATSSPIFFFDQDSTNALATGQSHTRKISLGTSAQAQPLRVTLVWSDPPGNPVAGVKLVNNLNLVVTNTDSGAVFFGNDFLLGRTFNFPWSTNTTPNIDVINNVQNVYLEPGMGTNFSITVIGSRVNVNAVTANTNGVVQDYALVISTGDGSNTNNISLTASAPAVAFINVPLVTVVSNMFAGSSNVTGGVLLGQHVGASSPLLGTNTLAVSNAVTLTETGVGQLTLGVTNQWHFYMVRNVNAFTNAAFVTFLPPTLSIPRMGVHAANNANATTAEADIDLYVSTDPGLTNLSPDAVSGAYKSLSRGGSETVVLSNATSGAYYVGVKCESQEGAEYGIASMFSLNPFGLIDGEGNQVLQGYPIDASIPDGTPESPQGVRIFALSVIPIKVHRVVVTNTVTHNLFGDLQGVLSHNNIQVVLNNHTHITNTPLTPVTFVYDDSSENVLPSPPAQHTDGPGSLNDFVGKVSSGQWMFTMINSSPGDYGTNNNLIVYLERQQDATNGIIADLRGGACRKDTIDVPAQATNLTVSVGIISKQPLGGPVTVTVCPPSGVGCRTFTLGSGTNIVTFDKYSNPPLNAGTYSITTCNGGSGTVKVYILATLSYDLKWGSMLNYSSLGTTPILDDAVTYSSINVTNSKNLVSLEVGVRIDHPRVSDLQLRLVAPDGTRELLCENRGALSTNGMGSALFSTNIVPVNSTGDWHASTNNIDTGQTSGVITINWDMYSLPDRMTVYYETNKLLDTGYIGGVEVTNLAYGPGNSTIVTVVMNEGNTNETTTRWDYTVSSTVANYLYFTFTEDTAKTMTPVKFAPPPFVSTNSIGAPPFSDFETNALAVYTNNVDGWTITSGQVAVTNNPPANTGSQALKLETGHLSRVLPTLAGRNYNLSFAYRALPSLAGLVSWWQGEANANDRLDVNNGTSPNGISYAPGEVGLAFSLDGVSQYVAVPDSPSLEPASFTVEGWFNFSARDGIRMLMAKSYGTGTADSFNVWYEGDFGELRARCRGASGDSPMLRWLFVPTYGVWYHIALSYDPVTQLETLYVNGVPEQWDTFAGPVPYDSHPFQIGADIENEVVSFFFNGLIDEVALFNRALTADEVVSIYLAGPAGKCGLPVPPAVCLGGNARLLIDGEIASTIIPTNFWQTNVIPFIPTTNGTTLAVSPVGASSCALLDTFSCTDTGSPYYVLPEEPMTKLTAKKAQGDWTLEILDNRVRATNPTPTLLHWQIGFVFEDVVALPQPLNHGETVTNTVAPGQIDYFTVSVPNWAQYATNWLISSTAPVNLLFNQQKPPTGTNEGDLVLLSNATNGIVVLSASTIPPLVPGLTYYLGIQNAGSNSATFVFQVDFDVTPLTLNVPLTGTNVSAAPRYFSYLVTSAETAVSFTLTNLSGDVNLVARYGLPFPTTSPGGYDYGSFSPGAFPEQIVVLTNSTPAPLAPGLWYLGVFNNDSVPVTYTILVTDYTNPLPNIIALTNGIAYTNMNPGTGNSLDYYLYNVEPGARRGQFEIIGPSGPMYLVASFGLPLPTSATIPYSTAPASTNDSLITVYDYSTPPLQSGTWFLIAVNGSAGAVNYSIKASDWTTYGTPIVIRSAVVTTNRLSFTWNYLAGVHYFVEGKTDLLSTNWTRYQPLITPPASLPWSVQLPTTNQFFRVGQQQ